MTVTTGAEGVEVALHVQRVRSEDFNSLEEKVFKVIQRICKAYLRGRNYKTRSQPHRPQDYHEEHASVKFAFTTHHSLLSPGCLHQSEEKQEREMEISVTARVHRIRSHAHAVPPLQEPDDRRFSLNFWPMAMSDCVVVDTVLMGIFEKLILPCTHALVWLYPYISVSGDRPCLVWVCLPRVPQERCPVVGTSLTSPRPNPLTLSPSMYSWYILNNLCSCHCRQCGSGMCWEQTQTCS